ncbi:zinc ribbon domain-containing protein, partial [Acinetobacter baumannii]|uniref:zinc ribbon domain-containing protein n=1 Tax=Acinetobacter baumannii TaxID=470 RepID=UPI00396F4E12
MLSGLLRCGICGGGMSSKGVHGGVLRVRCSRYSESGSCANPRSSRTRRIEAAVDGGLIDLIGKTTFSEDFLRSYGKFQRERIATTAKKVSQADARLAKLTAEQDRLIQWYST